jgi:hypothetical protein
MKHIYLIGNGSRAAQYGVGTYIRQMLEFFRQTSSVRLTIVELNSEVKEGPLYHLWHPRGENSGYATEELAFQNRMEFIKVCSMERNELREYIKSWKNNG